MRSVSSRARQPFGVGDHGEAGGLEAIAKFRRHTDEQVRALALRSE
jgi:hypothetical protein